MEDNGVVDLNGLNSVNDLGCIVNYIGLIDAGYDLNDLILNSGNNVLALCELDDLLIGHNLVKNLLCDTKELKLGVADVEKALELSLLICYESIDIKACKINRITVCKSYSNILNLIIGKNNAVLCKKSGKLISYCFCIGLICSKSINDRISLAFKLRLYLLCDSRGSAAGILKICNEICGIEAVLLKLEYRILELVEHILSGANHILYVCEIGACNLVKKIGNLCVYRRSVLLNKSLCIYRECFLSSHCIILKLLDADDLCRIGSDEKKLCIVRKLVGEIRIGKCRGNAAVALNVAIDLKSKIPKVFLENCLVVPSGLNLILEVLKSLRKKSLELILINVLKNAEVGINGQNKLIAFKLQVNPIGACDTVRNDCCYLVLNRRLGCCMADYRNEACKEHHRNKQQSQN